MLDALGDRTRRSILELLREGPVTVGELAARLPVSRPAVSQHLRVLQESGLVAHETVGTRHFYRVDSRGLTVLRDWLDDFWGTALESFAAFADKESSDGTAD